MTPINNSDTAWLVVSDYNQDNDISFEDLREDVLNPQINDWGLEHDGCDKIGGVGKYNVMHLAGSMNWGGHQAGENNSSGNLFIGNSEVGHVGYVGEHVGGNWYDPN